MAGRREGIPRDVEPAIACEQLVGVFADLQEFNEIPELRRVLRADVGSLAKKMLGSTVGSNHLTGCAVDIRVAGVEQLVRYATILIDIRDECQEDFDELLLERSSKGTYWLHFAVRPSGNRRKVRLIQT